MFKSEDAKKHKADLTVDEQHRWATIANTELKKCLAEGGKDCEAKATKKANAKCKDKNAGPPSLATMLRKGYRS